MMNRLITSRKSLSLIRNVVAREHCRLFSTSDSTDSSVISSTIANPTDDKSTRSESTDDNTKSFLESNDDDDVTEWVPPDRPLKGDLGQTFLYENRSKKTATTSPTAASTATNVDWLSTRRQALSLDVPKKNRKFANAELEIREGYLLSQSEITICLTNMGAQQVKVILDPQGRMGGTADGLVLSTATSGHHLQLLSETLVRQLKVRKLANRGVSGAQLGAEGKHSSTDWHVVDCQNYVVHIMLEETRRHLNLEALWSGNDELLKITLNDEDAVDDFVAKNPAPYDFGSSPTEYENMGKHVSQLQKWNLEHKAVVVKPKRKPGSKTRRSPRLL